MANLKKNPLFDDRSDSWLLRSEICEPEYDKNSVSYIDEWGFMEWCKTIYSDGCSVVLTFMF